ncbi:hypothetical protein TL16_g01907 [Triparma laevis f. inornata]|uniref:FYVE-type domain-containing protein n=2 Tax=Triparma laevis TaxID=1534972 RepID=A0A9W7EB05_9STRA|nr:hypothetical protein TL16_g01907 [Triparma laevis f. inornata]GMH72078.1 hypothetical protein TrLO_g6967 [Triparma laevis f. longispina]
MSSLQIMPLHEACAKTNVASEYIKSSLIKVFARTFFDEEVLGRSVGVTYQEMLTFCRTYVEVARLEQMSYIAVESGSSNVVAFLMVEDVAGPTAKTVKTGAMDALEKSTSDSLGKIFHCLESLHQVFKAKIGVDYRNPLRRGQYFHILSAGAIPEVRGSGVVMAMVAKMYMHLVESEDNNYLGMVTEATSFASQRLLKRTLLPEFGWVIEKDLSDFKNPDGKPMFKTVQTKTINLSYQFAASHGSLERTFQEALFYLGSDPHLLEGIPHIALRVYALHTLSVAGSAKSPRIFSLNLVNRAKYNAVQTLLKENNTITEIRQELVDIVQHTFPGWHQSLKSIRSVPISSSTQAKLMNALIKNINAVNSESINLNAIWVPDKFTSTCMRCTSKFSFTHRKHHCRICGLVVCQNCTPTNIPLPSWFKVDGLHRVCLHCVDATLGTEVERAMNEGKRSNANGARPRVNSRHGIRSLSSDTSGLQGAKERKGSVFKNPFGRKSKNRLNK